MAAAAAHPAGQHQCRLCGTWTSTGSFHPCSCYYCKDCLVAKAKILLIEKQYYFDCAHCCYRRKVLPVHVEEAYGMLVKSGKVDSDMEKHYAMLIGIPVYTKYTKQDDEQANTIIVQHMTPKQIKEYHAVSYKGVMVWEMPFLKVKLYSKFITGAYSKTGFDLATGLKLAGKLIEADAVLPASMLYAAIHRLYGEAAELTAEQIAMVTNLPKFAPEIVAGWKDFFLVTDVPSDPIAASLWHALWYIFVAKEDIMAGNALRKIAFNRELKTKWAAVLYAIATPGDDQYYALLKSANDIPLANRLVVEYDARVKAAQVASAPAPVQTGSPVHPRSSTGSMGIVDLSTPPVQTDSPVHPRSSTGSTGTIDLSSPPHKKYKATTGEDVNGAVIDSDSETEAKARTEPPTAEQKLKELNDINATSRRHRLEIDRDEEEKLVYVEEEDEEIAAIDLDPTAVDLEEEFPHGLPEQVLKKNVESWEEMEALQKKNREVQERDQQKEDGEARPDDDVFDEEEMPDMGLDKARRIAAIKRVREFLSTAVVGNTDLKYLEVYRPNTAGRRIMVRTMFVVESIQGRNTTLGGLRPIFETALALMTEAQRPESVVQIGKLGIDFVVCALASVATAHLSIYLDEQPTEFDMGIHAAWVWAIMCPKSEPLTPDELRSVVDLATMFTQLIQSRRDATIRGHWIDEKLGIYGKQIPDTVMDWWNHYYSKKPYKIREERVHPVFPRRELAAAEAVALAPNEDARLLALYAADEARREELREAARASRKGELAEVVIGEVEEGDDGEEEGGDDDDDGVGGEEEEEVKVGKSLFAAEIAEEEEMAATLRRINEDEEEEANGDEDDEDEEDEDVVIPAAAAAAAAAAAEPETMSIPPAPRPVLTRLKRNTK